MASLEQYEAFVTAVEHGSLTAAARQLDRSLQSVSRALASLETELGVELVRRTTRHFQPTPAGFAFYQQIKPALGMLDAARAEASNQKKRIGGLFRIGAPVQFAPDHVTPAVVAFLQCYPEVEIDFVLSDGFANLIRDRLDVVIRIGELDASSLKARRLASLRRVVVAAPAYLARHGYPKTPSDLANHRCVVRTFGPEGDAWPLTIGGKAGRIAVHGALRCNEAASANAAVVHGAGIGLAPLWQVRPDLDQGRLELLLMENEPPPIPVHAVWPSSTKTPARTRLFVDMMARRLAGERI
ncbi:MAG TPA: LysR family transcriptional regulator [Acidiphilium sp.]